MGQAKIPAGQRLLALVAQLAGDVQGLLKEFERALWLAQLNVSHAQAAKSLTFHPAFAAIARNAQTALVSRNRGERIGPAAMKPAQLFQMAAFCVAIAQPLSRRPGGLQPAQARGWGLAPRQQPRAHGGIITGQTRRQRVCGYTCRSPGLSSNYVGPLHVESA